MSLSARLQKLETHRGEDTGDEIMRLTQFVSHSIATGCWDESEEKTNVPEETEAEKQEFDAKFNRLVQLLRERGAI